jgi:hypothetical protein
VAHQHGGPRRGADLEGVVVREVNAGPSTVGVTVFWSLKSEAAVPDVVPHDEEHVLMRC